MNGKVVRIIIDNREYLFKLGSSKEIEHLQVLASQLNKRIQRYKHSIATNDYNKILVLTCLNLLEELSSMSKQKDKSPVASPIVNEKLFKRLSEIRDLLKK